jgi:cephalosporin-C deacetylase
MNAIARRIDELERYLPPVTRSAEELDAFWGEMLLQYADKPLNAKLKQLESPMVGTDVYEVSYEGFDDTRIYGWYLVPSFLQQEQYPCVVVYQGYTGDKGIPERYAAWLMLGYAVFAVDTRGQGVASGNRLAYEAGGIKGWVTQNILHRERCYYMAIAIDSFKAVEWVSGRKEIHARKIAVMGGSQGGGLALIVSALSEQVSLTIADIPNLCHMDFGLLNSTGSLTEASEFVKRSPDTLSAVLDTLSYFDMVNLAYRIKHPVYISVGLKDTVCCPETIFAAYNRIDAQKRIDVHPFAGHEVPEQQVRRSMQTLKEWKDA